MEKAKSFDIQADQEQDIPGQLQGAIAEIVRDQVRAVPSVGVQVSFTGNLMRLTYHSYEMHLSNPDRMRQAEHAAKKGLDETLKNIKKNIKEKAGKVPSFAEKKELSNTALQKVSLNERYMFSSWRFYELD